eukprot:2392122-Amphidinium_carterae.1
MFVNTATISARCAPAVVPPFPSVVGPHIASQLNAPAIKAMVWHSSTMNKKAKQLVLKVTCWLSDHC